MFKPNHLNKNLIKKDIVFQFIKNTKLKKFRKKLLYYYSKQS